MQCCGVYVMQCCGVCYAVLWCMLCSVVVRMLCSVVVCILCSVVVYAMQFCGLCYAVLSLNFIYILKQRVESGKIGSDPNRSGSATLLWQLRTLIDGWGVPSDLVPGLTVLARHKSVGESVRVGRRSTAN